MNDLELLGALVVKSIVHIDLNPALAKFFDRAGSQLTPELKAEQHRLWKALGRPAFALLEE
ncbi:MAG: hypothetical protein QQN63_00960 [Nitrosopumilus sp.]